MPRTFEAISEQWIPDENITLPQGTEHDSDVFEWLLSSPLKQVPFPDMTRGIRKDDLPCGSCDAGIYDMVPYNFALDMFERCQTRKQALAEAPRCKKDGRHICFGARDFIVCTDFPIDRAIAAAKAQED